MTASCVSSNVPSVCVCVWCQVISQTLSPTWNQSLLMARLLLTGDLQYIQEEPPRIVIEVYDDDALVSKGLNNQDFFFFFLPRQTCANLASALG